MIQFKKPHDEEHKKNLDPLQFKVTQEEATEPPFQNKYWDNHEVGLYVDVVTGEPLFTSIYFFKKFQDAKNEYLSKFQNFSDYLQYRKYELGTPMSYASWLAKNGYSEQ